MGATDFRNFQIRTANRIGRESEFGIACRSTPGVTSWGNKTRESFDHCAMCESITISTRQRLADVRMEYIIQIYHSDKGKSSDGHVIPRLMLPAILSINISAPPARWSDTVGRIRESVSYSSQPYVLRVGKQCYISIGAQLETFQSLTVPSSKYNCTFLSQQRKVYKSASTATMSTPEDAVTLTTRGKVAIITLNQPKKLNALSQDLYYRLSYLMREVAARKDIYITILTGTGRYFSA